MQLDAYNDVVNDTWQTRALARNLRVPALGILGNYCVSAVFMIFVRIYFTDGK